MTLAYVLSKTGHPNCRRPDKVIDARHPDQEDAAEQRAAHRCTQVCAGSKENNSITRARLRNDPVNAPSMLCTCSGGILPRPTGEEQRFAFECIEKLIICYFP